MSLPGREDAREIGIRLVAMCYAVESAIGSGGIKETLDGLLPMVENLGLDESRSTATVEGRCRKPTGRDRGVALVKAAFEEQ